MASADEYNRDLERVLQEAQHGADWAREQSAKADLQRRQRSVGWKWSEFYKACTTPQAPVTQRIVRRRLLLCLSEVEPAAVFRFPQDSSCS
jgi:hypothetical protein